MTVVVAALSALTLAAPSVPPSAAVAEGDWPQYLGPTRDGVAPWPEESFTWPADGPQIVWRVETGPGYGGVAIADGEVFLFDREKDEGDVLRVFDLASGEELWAEGYEQKGRLNFDGSRTVPTVVGNRVFTASGFGPVACFDREEQTLAWIVDVGEELGGVQPMFGWCVHPVAYDDVVLAGPLGASTGVVALDQETGNVRWETGHVGFSHSAPSLVTWAGRDQLLFNTCPKSGSGQDEAAPGTIWSFDPKTGETLWRHDLTLCRLPIPAPIVIDDNTLFATGGYRAGSVLLRTKDAKAKGVAFEEVFRSTRGAQIHAPFLYEDHIYALVNENYTNSRRRRGEGGLVCFDLSGKEKWRTGDDPNFGRGGLVRVADAFLVQDGFQGDLAAVRATPEGYEELGRFEPFEIRQRDGQLWAPPAISGTKILMRSQSELVCVELAP
ncbi:MAG: PQQ-binding-like beta-propeller repeat protein [Planctomycetota bacterium]